VLVATVLRPEQREDGELEVVRLALEQLLDTTELPVGQPEGAVERLFGDPRQGFESSDGAGWEPYRSPMRVIRKSSEAEVVAEFLRAELDSPRYGERIRELLYEARLDVSMLIEPGLEDPEANERRARILEEHRAWLRREGLFNGFPEDVAWSLVGLAPDEVLSILYIDWDWWLDLSGGTRRPLDAAARIRDGAVPGADADSDELIAARLRSDDPPPALIVASTPELSRLVLVEGHARLTAYALFPEYLPDELGVYLGTSEDMRRWVQF